MARAVGQGGLALLRQWELGPGGKPALVPYKDHAGYDTIGYGHRLRPGDARTLADNAAAEALLLSDTLPAASAVELHVHVGLNANQFDALACFAFNVGSFNFITSTLVDDLNVGDYHLVPEQLKRWDHARDPVTGKEVEVAGLLNRRQAEIDLWLTPC